VDGKYLYYTVSPSPSILRKQSLETGAEQDVLTNVMTLPGFAMTAAGIYYLSSSPGDGPAVYWFDFASQSSRRLASLDKPAANGFAASPDGRRILFTQQETNESNLMLLRNLP
jgi:hypothetical protein